MSKPISAVLFNRKMTNRESDVMSLHLCGKPFGAWHKPKRIREDQLKFGVGVPVNFGSNAKKRARLAKRDAVTPCCGRKLKNCRCPQTKG